MKLIDKDALVAKIENLANTYKKCPTFNSYEDGLKDGRQIGYKDALYKIDTLEVKEAVDAEIVEVEDNNNSMYAYTHLEICTDEDLSKICKAGDKAKVIIIKQK